MKTTKRLSIFKKLLFSLIATLIALVGLDLGLGFFGIKPVTSNEDPFVGFSNQIPLLEPAKDNDGQEIMRTADSKLIWFNDQSFPKKKAPNTFRVFCLGGSTTYGHPYWDPTSYSRWLREFLPIVDPSKRYEVVNLGGISYASYRVAGILEELTQYEPDLFIIYSVHNEFLERRTYAGMFEQSPLRLRVQATLARTRTWAAMDRMFHGKLAKAAVKANSKTDPEVLPGEVDEILNHTIGPIDYHRDSQWQSKVLRHYKFNLSRMVKLARGCGAKIVFLTPASNEKDCSPFKSEWDAKLTGIQIQQLEDLLDQASMADEKDQVDEALALLRSALQIDEHFAATHYQRGRLLMGLNRHEEAYQSFRRALNDDVCPIRAVDGIMLAIREIEKEYQVLIIDFEGRLRALCKRQHGHSIFGEEYFMDHVHPTVEVHQQLATWILQDLQEHGIVAGKPISDASLYGQVAKVIEKVHLEVDTQAYAIALRNLAKVLHWAGKFDEAEGRARDALERMPDDSESRFVLADCLRNTGRIEESIDEFNRLFATTDFERAYHPFGDMLAKYGDYPLAKVYLILAAVREPNSALARYTLGFVHLQLGEYDFAVESLTDADRLYPDDPRTLYYLAQAKVGNDEIDDAIDLYERLLEWDYETATVHFALGMIYFERKQYQEATTHFESSIQIDPAFEEAQKYLEISRSK